MNIKKIVLKPYYKLLSIRYMHKLKSGITKSDFTIISNDCCGGVIYHRIGKKFCSPFINLYISHDDFITILGNLDFYLEQELISYDSEERYPIGVLGNESKIKIHFMHYKSFEEAKLCWDRRKQRIIKDKIFVLFNLTNSLDEIYVNEYVKKISKLGYENYIVLSRFDSNNKNVRKIDFSDLKSFHNAQVLAPQKYPFKLHIDQLNYKELFQIF